MLLCVVVVVVSRPVATDYCGGKLGRSFATNRKLRRLREKRVIRRVPFFDDR